MPETRKSSHAKRKSGFFEYKAVIGTDEYGLEKRKSFYSGKSLADAKAKARRYLEDRAVLRASGDLSAQTSVLFETVAERWLKLYKKGHVKGNTYYGTYVIPVRKHLLPRFGKRDIGLIRHSDIQAFLNEKAKGYCAESVKKMKACLSAIFVLAVSDDLLQKDPMAGPFSMPKCKKSAAKRAYTRDQRDRVLDFARKFDGPGRLDIAVLLKTGITRSELLGLKPENLLDHALDIVQGTAAVYDETANRRKVVSDGLKNKFRRRTIPIDSELYEQLLAALRNTAGEKTSAAPEFLFHTSRGNRWDPDNWRRRVYEPFMKAMHEVNPDIPILHAHEMRHTFATLAKEDGVDDFYIMSRAAGCLKQHTGTVTWRRCAGVLV